ncbi:MAG: Ig-like domain-containing protein, partial [Thermoplasmata archaeon]|nr:Ig-like domain-containing protein [Thermoplasmata archaeon]
MKRSAIAIVIVLLASVLVQPTASSQDDEELILRVAMQDDMKTTNPLVAGDVWTWNVLKWLYEGATMTDPETDELVPYIAVGSANQSSELSSIDWDDCTVGNFGYCSKNTWENASKPEAVVFYDFEDVYWHDGTQMSIRDVMFSFHIMAQVPEWASSLNCLKDNGGRTGSDFPDTHHLHIENVYESEDGSRAALKFTLQEPFSNFFESTLSGLLLPYHIWGYEISGQNVDEAKIWCDTGYDRDSDDAWKIGIAQAWENPDPIGSGIFEWGYWDHGFISKISTWRDHFYRPGYKYDDGGLSKQPIIDAIVFKIYKTATAAVLALKSDDIDFIGWTIGPTLIWDLVNEPGISVHQAPEEGFFYLGYNMRRQSFGYNESKSYPYLPEDDLGKPFRIAVAHCIDKERIVDRLLLGYGTSGDGPIPPSSPWYNASIPHYGFDPQRAIEILENAEYQLTNPEDAPGPDNYWLNPDGSAIGSDSGGSIHILTPNANYDPIRAQAGLMIARQLREIGIYAECYATMFGSILNRIDQRDFDMFILGWNIGSDPTDFFYSFWHSDTAAHGQNYVGYQNASFDELIYRARATDNETLMKELIFEAQAAIAYDRPIDVCYFKNRIFAYTSKRLVGWSFDSREPVLSRKCVLNLRVPPEFRLFAKFISPPSAMASNTSTTITIQVTDQNREPVPNVKVMLNASFGTLGDNEGITNANGKFTTTYSAPYVPPTDFFMENGTKEIIQITEATYTINKWEYFPAESR